MTKRKAALILTISFVFVMLIAHVFVIAEADHDCSGEDCPVCAVIAVISDTLRELSMIGPAILTCSAVVFFILKSSFVNNTINKISSPVTLKVKLSD